MNTTNIAEAVKVYRKTWGEYNRAKFNSLSLTLGWNTNPLFERAVRERLQLAPDKEVNEKDKK